MRLVLKCKDNINTYIFVLILQNRKCYVCAVWINVDVLTGDQARPVAMLMFFGISGLVDEVPAA